jgi:hypothetical protein
MIVHVLVISHQFGADTWVHRTYDGAKQSLVAYCKRRWDNEITDDNNKILPIPIEADEIIYTYFDNDGGEDWAIDKKEVLP